MVNTHMLKGNHGEEKKRSKKNYMIFITTMVVPISSTTRLNILFKTSLMDICGLITFSFYRK